MIEINTSALKSRKRVEIDGHPYVVRRYGAGEQLTLNQLLREAKKIEAKTANDTATEDDEIAAEDLSKKMMTIFAGLFDDGGDGTKSMELVSSLSQEEVQELFDQIFTEDKDGTPAVS